PRKWLFAAALTGSFLLFVIVGFVVVPAVNLALGQAPIDLGTTITHGVYEAMFLMSSKPVGSLIGSVSPGSLLETILSPHTLPSGPGACRFRLFSNGRGQTSWAFMFSPQS